MAVFRALLPVGIPSYAGAADPPGLSRERQGAGASAGVGVGVARAGAPREAAERRRGGPGDCPRGPLFLDGGSA